MADAGQDLDGPLAECNPEAQQAMAVSLQHLHYILRMLTHDVTCDFTD